MKVFVRRDYLAVLGQFLCGISPELIREGFEGLIDADTLEAYLVDIQERYQDVIKWS
jgi:hypothetical protein